MIYTDGIHMISSESVADLHDFARRQAGLPARWFHPSPRHPHYDLLTDEAVEQVFALGAVRISSKEIVRMFHENPQLTEM